MKRKLALWIAYYCQLWLSQEAHLWLHALGRLDGTQNKDLPELSRHVGRVDVGVVASLHHRRAVQHAPGDSEQELGRASLCAFDGCRQLIINLQLSLYV